jgi:hypothetical protein
MHCHVPRWSGSWYAQTTSERFCSDAIYRLLYTRESMRNRKSTSLIHWSPGLERGLEEIVALYRAQLDLPLAGS